MFEILAAAYPWVKTAHVVSMVAWMAGLFYLPRLFVYHVEAGGSDPTLHATFTLMERRLFRYIMGPAMTATWVFGVILLLTPGVISWSTDLWIYVKLLTVALLTWFHHWLGYRRKDLAAGRNRVSGRVYRLANELPTVALIVIVTMVIVRPF